MLAKGILRSLLSNVTFFFGAFALIKCNWISNVFGCYLNLSTLRFVFFSPKNSSCLVVSHAKRPVEIIRRTIRSSAVSLVLPIRRNWFIYITLRKSLICTVHIYRIDLSRELWNVNIFTFSDLHTYLS